MTDAERNATLSICLLASLADGVRGEQERAQLEKIVASLSGGVDPSAAGRDVLVGGLQVEDAARALQSPEVKRLAWEMAVVVCDADGARGEQERVFLERLRAALGLDPAAAEAFARSADALASVPLGAASPAQPGPATQPPDPAALDQKIRNYAVLNGALELLPGSLATMAIVPLQLKMVYEIGKAHGYQLDAAHAKDFVAAAGVGLGAQVLEDLGRKLVGGLLGTLGGGLLRGLGSQATGTAMSFVTTYALGQLARRYYAGGRTMSTELLRQTYQGLLDEARSLRTRHAGDIEAKARTLDPAQLLGMVRGGTN